MFNWTTTTIINSLKDYTTGADLIKVWTGASGEDAAGLKAGFSGTYPVIKIKRDKTFETRYISKIYKAIANNPILCEMTVNCENLRTLVTTKPAHVRLSFYVALEGSEESIYANDWYQKGKPFSIGFDVTATDTAATIAAKIKKNAEKFGVVIYGKKVFDLIDNGDNTLTLKGTHEYQRFKMAAVAIDDIIDEQIVDYFEDGAETTSEGGVFELVQRGVNGFGTYHQLVKDLRLPTAHHTKWLQLKEDEKPVVGAKYNQYIITYCAPSMANPGFTVIGQHNMSVTTHVFWVNQAVDAEFQAALTAAGISPEVVNTVTVDEQTKADTAVAPTEAGVKTAANAGTNYSVNHEQTLKDKKD